MRLEQTSLAISSAYLISVLKWQLGSLLLSREGLGWAFVCSLGFLAVLGRGSSRSWLSCV